MTKRELTYLIALQKLPNIGDTTIKKLIDRIGSAEAVYTEKKTNLLKIDGIGLHKIKEIGNSSFLDVAQKEIAFFEKEDIKALDYKHPAYPLLLKHCIDGPSVLFTRGNIDLKNKKIISIVGTRKVTKQGVAFCEELIKELAVLKPIIVSGFAYGTDICAHKAAIKNNLQTIACLAHGLNQIYPKPHAKYVNEVEKNGGFVTDFLTTSSFDRNNFLKRNRIIAGMSEASIVIESAPKGGSLVTADIANSYNREVFAVPGRPTDSMSRGCINLIKKNQARPITEAADLIYHLGWDLEEKSEKNVQTQLFIDLNAEEQNVVDCLKKENKQHIDELAVNSSIPSYKLASLLLDLEMKGVLRPLPGKLFELI